MYPIFEGRVVHGFGIGQALGFPTANIETANSDIPPDGVYVVQVSIDNSLYCGMMSIGCRPTFETDTKTLEVHLLGFSGDLYQKILTIKPLYYIRENKKFENPDLLKQQLHRDKDFALKYAQNKCVL
jgi:riboflavin kinase/FMN adenylyltransferase